MEWRDEGMVLSVRKHGETSVIIEVLTAAHGRHAGVVRGGTSRKLKPVLQIGSQVQVDWSARLEGHLGAYRVEPVRSRAAQVMGDRRALEGLNAVCELARFCLGERDPLGQFYHQTLSLVDRISPEPAWIAEYALWEAALLVELGFGLDLESCAATGSADELIYVSPKSGRAVSRKAGAPWAERLLPLPEFMKATGEANIPDVLKALHTTGYFLSTSVAPALGKEDLPEARARFISVLERDVRSGSGAF